MHLTVSKLYPTLRMAMTSPHILCQAGCMISVSWKICVQVKKTQSCIHVETCYDMMSILKME